MPSHPKPSKRKKKQTGLTTSLRSKVACRDNFKCQLCGRDITVLARQIHHVIFTGMGGNGDNSMSNLLTLCFDCHIRGIHGGGKDAQKLREAAVTKMEEINADKM